MRQQELKDYCMSLGDPNSLTESQLTELETRTMLVLAPRIEGRTNIKLADLAQECRQYLEQDCVYLTEFTDYMRDC